MNYENEYDNTLPAGVKPDKPKGTVVWQILFYLALTLLCFSVTGTAVTAMLGLYRHTAVDPSNTSAYGSRARNACAC